MLGGKWFQLTFFITVSNADMRSLAIKSSLLSSTLNRSRTLPEANFSSLPCRSIATIAGGAIQSRRCEFIADISVVRVGRARMHSVDQSCWVVRGGRQESSRMLTEDQVRIDQLVRGRVLCEAW